MGIWRPKTSVESLASGPQYKSALKNPVVVLADVQSYGS